MSISHRRCTVVVGAVIVFWLALFSAAQAGQRSAGTVYLPHPAGCPRVAFCGCGASVEVFGKSIRSLWLSAAWFKFPRAAPAPGMVAVRRGHVFVIAYVIDAKTVMAKDHNSGGHRSRLHARSIAGYVVVNPQQRTAGV